MIQLNPQVCGSLLPDKSKAKMNLVDLKNLTQKELESLMQAWGQAPFRARQIQKWIFKGVTDFAAMSDISKELRLLLQERCYLSQPKLVACRQSADGSVRYTLELEDGLLIDSVYIPEEDHATLCLSSQVGCAQGCRFCLTARQGFSRNLTVAEILNQIFLARSLTARKPPITNLVFMGMGEPLANFANLVKALEIILAPWGFNFSFRRVTVATVGLVPFIPRLGREVRVNLAVSLNAPDDTLRQQLMPVARKYPLADLLAACRDFPLPPHRRITFTYVLLKGVNDSPEQARALAKLLRGQRAKINLIPFNPHPCLPFDRPSEEAILAFQEVLVREHYTTIIRESRGLDIGAACGQLAVNFGRDPGSTSPTLTL